jgi:hypothetical protein
MYLILPDPRLTSLRGLYRALGLKEEVRFSTKKSFWHLSARSRFWNSIFADTLIIATRKPAASTGTLRGTESAPPDGS